MYLLRKSNPIRKNNISSFFYTKKCILLIHKWIKWTKLNKQSYQSCTKLEWRSVRWVSVWEKNKRQRNKKTKERKDVTVPGVYDAVPIVHDDHSDVVSATRSVAPAPKRRTPSRHGRVRFRRKSALLFAPPFLLLLALLITFWRTIIRFKRCRLGHILSIIAYFDFANWIKLKPVPFSTLCCRHLFD